MKQLTVLLLSLLCCAALAARPQHAGKPFGKASSLIRAGKSLPRAPLDSGWAPIAALVHDDDTDRVCQACAYDPVHDKLYMYGGTPRGFPGSEVPYLDRYDPVRDTWEPMADMLIPRSWIKGLYCRGKLYAMGGFSSDSGSGGALATCEAYDIATNAWSFIHRLPEARGLGAAVCWRDSLIFLLGGGSSGATGDIRVYDPFRDTWMAAAEQAPDSLWQDDACIIGDTIYIAGSLDRSSLMKGGIDPANPLQINWSSGPALPCGDRYLGPTVALAGKVYFFGGYTQAVTREGWVYDPRTGAFDTLPLLPAATGTGTVRWCFGVARDSGGEIYKLAGDDNGDWSPPNRTYYRLQVSLSDAGTERILAPAAVTDSGDTVIPSAVVRNYGNVAVGFRVMFRIDTSYVRFDSAYLGVGDSAQVSFSPWFAGQSGMHAAKCSTMLTGDVRLGNDAVQDSFVVSAFDAGVVGLNLPETLVADTFTPKATVQSLGRTSGWVDVAWRVLQADSLSVYFGTESTYLDSGASQRLTFPSWNLTFASYLAKVYALHNGIVLGDTTRKHFWVASTGIAESNQEPLPRAFALDIVSPNPSRDAVTIRYALPKAADISLKLYDATGKLEATFASGPAPAGASHLELRPSHLSCGVYLLRLETGNNTLTRKLIIE
jgi:hypothetical protein